MPIYDMAERHFGLTDAVAENYVEAARVCLDQHHESPVTFQVKGKRRKTSAVVKWDPPDDRTKAAWANENDAARDGAYACVLAALELLCGFTAVRRSETKSGADYYVAHPGMPADDIENLFRLEVSGVGSGNSTYVANRLNEKLKQTEKGNSNLPAFAGVVGFRAQLIRLAQA